MSEKGIESMTVDSPADRCCGISEDVVGLGFDPKSCHSIDHKADSAGVREIKTDFSAISAMNNLWVQGRGRATVSKSRPYA